MQMNAGLKYLVLRVNFNLIGMGKGGSYIHSGWQVPLQSLVAL